MKIILLFLMLSVASLTAQTTTQKLRDTLKSAEAQLEEQKIEIQAKDGIILAQKGYLLNSAVSLIQAQKDVIQVQKDSDENHKQYLQMIKSYSVLQQHTIEVEDELKARKGRELQVSLLFGALCSLAAYLLVTKLLGKAAVLAGPYAIYIYLAASALGFGAGAMLVGWLFRG